MRVISKLSTDKLQTKRKVEVLEELTRFGVNARSSCYEIYVCLIPIFHFGTTNDRASHRVSSPKISRS